MLLLATLCFSSGLARDKKQPARAESPLDRYIREARSEATEAPGPSPGSLYRPGAWLGDLARDLRSSQVNDLVTIVVSDSASAVARGTTNSSRKSTAKGAVNSLYGIRTGALPSLAELGSESALQGQGETSRSNTLTTTLSARVTHVLPNGYMVVEGAKDVTVNSERQVVSVRGIVRWNDLGPSNLVRSDRLANIELRVNGKGIVNDAVRRPNFLYRLLLGLLPF